jgi:hypothetical protein
MKAQKLFTVSTEKETVVDRLEDLIAIPEDANSTALSYKTTVEGHDPDNTMSEHKEDDYTNEIKISCTGLPNCN